MLSFLTRLCSPDKLAAWSPEAQQSLQAAFIPLGHRLVQLLIAGSCGALPAGRIPEICDALHAILRVGFWPLALCLLNPAWFTCRQSWLLLAVPHSLGRLLIVGFLQCHACRPHPRDL